MRATINMELKDCSELAKAHQGRYEGDDIYLRRISNEVKARRGEYTGFGRYLRQLNDETKARSGSQSVKRFPTKIIAVSAASLAVAGVGLLTYFFRVKKKRQPLIGN
jgi:hypothetical protein